ncbi:uncharacterized protein K444DRAFT_663185 [Hyaloscypha bicolor E]|uniref:Uncharacterized protein n=1 Tax=Hyaloscypha bicolor E TaxID=1095630 RepID=A0A2J6TBF1_9HELO|nr:uncharacterized protein K444DRAFT_663185 [Hyaloscypha bicolor E]PMD60359.1 hypothetical protein K444DRAFT_663185 [Hyaloscypha bicolor E]
MISTPIITPALSIWLQQLAGILPLTALIEFIDIPTKLHVFELSGSVSLWNWPITPAGARLLLLDEHTSYTCCLDEAGYSQTLHCIDGRHGDCYPSSSPATVRLGLSTHRVDTKVPNSSVNMKDVEARRQRLEVFNITRLESVAGQSAFPWISKTHSLRYKSISLGGWLCWLGVTTICLLAKLYIGAAYLILMPMTGLLVYLIRGGKSRPLLNERVSGFKRLVVATKNLNGSEWWAFYGCSNLLNSLLNKPLYRTCTTPAPKLLKVLLQLLIAGQWVLAIGSCAMQNWNAFVITFWIVFCAWASTYGYRPEDSVQDWLHLNCNIGVKRIQTEFSSRRSMLSTIVYLNPDTKEDCTNWINPILTDSKDRLAWQSTLLKLIATGTLEDEKMKETYWWKYVLEGLEMGKKIERVLSDQSKRQKSNV